MINGKEKKSEVYASPNLKKLVVLPSTKSNGHFGTTHQIQTSQQSPVIQRQVPNRNKTHKNSTSNIDALISKKAIECIPLKPEDRKPELNNKIRLSYEYLVMEQMMRRRNRNNSFTNRDKFIAYSYGSTYSNSLMSHYRQIDPSKVPSQKNCGYLKMKIVEQQLHRQKMVNPKDLQRMNVLKIRKKVKVNENIFKIKSMIINQKSPERQVILKPHTKQSQQQLGPIPQLQNQQPIQRQSFKIKKSKHNASSIHSSSKGGNYNEDQLKCQSIKFKDISNTHNNQIVQTHSETQDKDKEGCFSAEQKRLVKNYRPNLQSYKENRQSSELSAFQMINHKLLQKIKKFNNYVTTYRIKNCITYRLKESSDKGSLKVYIGNGNNNLLIKELVKKRWWWAITPEKSTAKFVWTQLKTKLNSSGVLHNHIDKNQEIGYKKSIYLNIKRYCDIEGLDPFKYLPLTFLIKKSSDQSDQGTAELLEYLSSEKQGGLWIIKPGQNSNRGHGISISPSSQIKKILGLDDDLSERTEQKKHKNTNKTFIIQKYIMNPLLYHNRKFDIRCFALITKLSTKDTGIKVLWVKEGYIRTSGYEYDLKKFTNQYIHLTNDAIQSRSQNYGKYQDANKVSYETFEEFIFKKSNGSINFLNTILPQIKGIVKLALISCLSKIVMSKSQFKPSFELLGFDFMIDQYYEPILIEINTNPCFETSCMILKKIIPKMVDDTLKMTMDMMCPPLPSQNWPPKKYYQAVDLPESFEQFDDFEEQLNNYLHKTQNQVLKERERNLENFNEQKMECTTMNIQNKQTNEYDHSII